MTTKAQDIFLTIEITLGVCCTYLNLTGEMLAIYASIMFIDIVSGIFKSYKIGEAITSHRLWVGVITKISLILVLLVLALMAKALGADGSWFLGVVTTVLVLSEGYSVIGNVVMINKGYAVPELDALSIILTMIREYISKITKIHDYNYDDKQIDINIEQETGNDPYFDRYDIDK